MKLSPNLLEAANRAEVSALLIRLGYKVYRPEADDQGEDLIVRSTDGRLIPVQLKSRVTVNWGKYGEKQIWMLFPDQPWKIETRRQWYLIPHDLLFAILEKKHGHTASFADKAWSVSSPSKDLKAQMSNYTLVI